MSQSENRSTAEPLAPGEGFFSGIPFEDVLGCIHCGLCLDSCPTYRELGTEQDSPRGRIYLMRALWEGTLPAEPKVMEPLDRCVACRACETACPTRVPYGHLLEKTREAHVRSEGPKSWRLRLQRAGMNWVLGGKGRAAVCFSLLAKLYQFSGLPQLFSSKLAGRLLPKRWVAAHRVMPRFEGYSFKNSYRKATPAKPGPRVALFTGCIMDVADHEVHLASIALLEAAGYQVEVPANQGCCGALHAHRGFAKEARKLACNNIAQFPQEHFDAVVVNAAGCGAQLKDYPLLLEHHPVPDGWSPGRWQQKVVDLMMLLAETSGLRPELFEPAPPITVLYDAPCHLLHAQRGDAPVRQLLQSIPGVRLVALPEAERCCGAGGIYNLMQPQLSEAMLARKLEDIRQTQTEHPLAKVLLSANPGCLYQLRAGCRAAHLPMTVLHPAVFLATRLR